MISDELTKQSLVIIGLFCGVRCVGHSLGVDIAEILHCREMVIRSWPKSLLDVKDENVPNTVVRGNGISHVLYILIMTLG